MTEKKLICVVGATGNQGGSVARRFLQDSRFKVRGLTRNNTSPASLELAALGAEMVNADLDDVDTLKQAFKDANVIFSVTQYWEPFTRPDCRLKAKELGITCRRYAYDVEYQQGKNITDAAATTVETLDENGFLVSTLSHARKCSNGEYTELYHFDSKADIFPYYVRETYPALAAKMSCIQTGYFMTSHNILPNSYFQKLSDGSIQMRFPTHPDRLIPHLDVNGDTGNFVYAVYQMPPGKDYMAMGSQCSWKDFITLWSKVTGHPTSYKQVPFDVMVADTADRDLGIETAHMFSYNNDPGYDGGMDLLTAEDLKKVSPRSK
ncbi:putativelike family protein [Phaeomoniella chlamydospora]|uniref:Putativelike family protein n=1 Tax=Phaeomoniella chlamydospora TaxID=158046 RepID=A0A0G2E064_PHACM|nr:putativelike family protein [Phaeomoniella chlamydospora]